jgi:hypothetical protein
MNNLFIHLFAYGLFDRAVRDLDYIMSDGRTRSE